MCYPDFSMDGKVPKPSVWRGPTAQMTTNPQWNAAYPFRFRWTGVRSLSKSIPRLPSREDGIAPNPCLDDLDAEAKLDMVLKAARSLSSELQQHKSDMDHLRQSIRSLTIHVDQVRETHPNLPSSHPASSADMDTCPPIRPSSGNQVRDDSLAG